MSLPRTFIAALAIGATMFALSQKSLSAAQRFNALFDQPEPAGMHRTTKSSAGGQRSLFDGEVLRSPQRSRKDRTPFVNYVEIYCDRLENRYTSDHPAQVRRVLTRFIEYRRLFQHRLRDIHALEIEEYLSQRKKDTWRGKLLSPRTLNNELEIINQAFTFAGPKDRTKGGRKHLCWLNDPPYCELLPEPDLNPVQLMPEQIQAFVRATQLATSPNLDGCSPQDFWLSVLIVDFLTLLRRRALLLVSRPSDEMLLERKQLFIPAAINKTKQDVYVTLGSDDSIPQILARLPSKPGEPLLPWRRRDGRPLSANYFSRYIKQFQDKAGISDAARLKLKFIRSTSANIVEDAFDELTAKSKLKHSPNTNTYGQNYRVRRPKTKEVQATDRLKSYLFDLIAKTPDQQPELKVIG